MSNWFDGDSRLFFSVNKISILWAISTVFCLTLIGCSSNQSGRGEKGPQGRGVPTVSVHTTRVQKVSMDRQVTLSGTIISPDQAKVSSEVPGVIQKVAIELGQEVRRGQAMIYLDSRELEFALRRSESQLRQTEAQLGIDGEKIREPLPVDQIASVRTAIANRNDARSQLVRSRQMFEQKLVPQSDLDAAQTRMEVTEAAYQSAIENVVNLKAALQDRRAAVELARKKLSDAIIRAPVAGAISERLVQNGEFIAERTPVCTIVQMNPLKLKTAIQERYVSRIEPKQIVKFNVESYPEEEFQGRIAFISPAIDQATRTFVVEALVDNPKRQLKPGFFAKGTVYTHTDENVSAVNEDAISTLAGVSTVFIIQENSIRQQAVTLGAKKGNLVEVITGIEGNEILAASNLSQLATGVLVKTTGEISSDMEGKAQAETEQVTKERAGSERTGASRQ